MQGAGIYKFATTALMDAFTPVVASNHAVHAYPEDTQFTYEWDNTNSVWRRIGSGSFTWYSGGDDMRVWATYDPFISNYTKTAAGQYAIVVPAGEQLDKFEFQVNTTGANVNIQGGGLFQLNLTTPNGNTNTLDTSVPKVWIQSPFGTGNNTVPSGTTASSNSLGSITATGGTATISVNPLTAHATGKVSITNLIQNT